MVQAFEWHFYFFLRGMGMTILLILLLPELSAQKTSFIDTQYVDAYRNTWSIRAYSIIKAQGLSLRNEQGGDIRYLPDNLFGIGIGISYKFLVLDLGLTLQGDDNISQRIDLQSTLFLRKHVVDIYFQAYQGFELVEPKVDNPNQKTRKDIRSLAFGFSYYYNFNGNKMAVRVMTNGEHRQKKTSGSWLLGAFSSFFYLKADSSLIPAQLIDFPEAAQFQNIHLNSFGLAGGYTQIWSLPKGWSLFLAAIPGIGLNGGRLKTEEWFSPPFAPVFKFQGGAGLGFSSQHIYGALNLSSDNYWLNLGMDNRFQYNLLKVRLSLGYRFSKKK